MVTVADLVAESDQEHGEALEKTGYWGKRAAGAIFFSQKTQRFGLGLRSQGVLEPGTLGSVGGAIDGDEDVEEAIKREIDEETGLASGFTLKPIFIFKDGNFSYHNYVAIVPDEFEPQLNWENDDIIWLTLDEMQEHDGLHYGMHNVLGDAKAMSILSSLQ